MNQQVITTAPVPNRHRTTFIVVSTLEEAPVREAEFFINALEERDFHLGALVLNKVLPAYFLDDNAAAVAEVLCRKADPIASEIAEFRLGDADHVAGIFSREKAFWHDDVEPNRARDCRQRDPEHNLLCLEHAVEAPLIGLEPGGEHGLEPLQHEVLMATML